jgi:type I restriction enzyme S subunit
MNLEIPLPPIEKQKRIVAKLEKLLGKVKEAKRLRAKAQAATASLLPATLHKIFSEGSDRGWQVKPFSEVVKIEAQKNTKVLPYVGMEDIESGTGRFTGSKSAKRVKSNTSWFNTKHILYGKLRPYLNKFLMPDFEGHCSTELLPLLPDPRYLSRGWLATWLRQNNIVEKINATGAGSRMPRANMKLVAKFLIPLPSLAEQRKIVAHLDQLSEKIHQLQEYQKQTAADLDALEKSILHQAFSGGL